MITATLRIIVGQDKKAEVNRLLRSLVGPTRVEAGCISCRLYHEADEPNIVANMIAVGLTACCDSAGLRKMSDHVDWLP